MARASKTADGLTERQERFALAYFKLANASQAYREAYNPKMASNKTVNEKASRLLKLGKIGARVAELRAAQESRTILDVRRLEAELARVCFSRISDYFDAEGRFKSMSELSEDALAALAGVESFDEFEGKGGDRVRVGVTRKVKLWDKVAALEKAYRHKGMFAPDNKQKADPVTALIEWVSAKNAASGTHGLPIKA